MDTAVALDAVVSTKLKLVKNEDNSYQCERCSYASTRKSNLLRHFASMHTQFLDKMECCGVHHADKSSYRLHVKTHHKNGYSCAYCHKNFIRRSMLKRHYNVHMGFKDYQCNLCSYATNHKSNLERHMETQHFVEGGGAAAAAAAKERAADPKLRAFVSLPAFGFVPAAVLDYSLPPYPPLSISPATTQVLDAADSMSSTSDYSEHSLSDASLPYGGRCLDKRRRERADLDRVCLSEGSRDKLGLLSADVFLKSYMHKKFRRAVRNLVKQEMTA